MLVRGILWGIKSFKIRILMLTLFYKPTCPFCQRVLKEAEIAGVRFNLKDISTSEEIAEELIAKGGKRQVPYLVDEERGEAMYESGEIIEYIKEHYEA